MSKPGIIVMGSFVADLMGRGPRLPGVGETVKGGFFKMGPGGKGANQAVAAARAGGEVSMITQLGNDDFGEMAMANFRAEGIGTSGVSRTNEHPTGAALILVDENTGDNSILVIPGACDHLDPARVEAAIAAQGKAKVLVVQLETNMDAMSAALAKARELGMMTVCNPAPAQEIPPECYPLIDYLTPNEAEASTLSGLGVKTVEDAGLAAEILRSRGAATVIVTLGDKGSLVLDRKGQYTFVPAYRVEVVDTTGAGDSYNGAFAVAIAEGRDVVAAASFASAAAAISVTRIGTAPAMPFRSEIEELVRAGGS